jgi:drug/metabolite transporter (DMT)-like permease
VPSGARAQTQDSPALGYVQAVLSACAFAISGPLAQALFVVGWSSAAVTASRALIGALAILPFALRGIKATPPHRAQLRGLIVFGLVALGGGQLCFLTSVKYMPVAAALMIESMAPALVVLWMWLVRSARPAGLSVAGGLVALIGLAFVLDVGSSSTVGIAGVAWALGALVCSASYILMSSAVDSGLSSSFMGAVGSAAGAALVGLLGVLGIMPLRFTFTKPLVGTVGVPWWAVLLVMGALSSGIGTFLGISGARRLGPRMAGYVALSVPLAGAGWAWMLSGQKVTLNLALGGVLILGGVLLARLGEPGPSNVSASPTLEVPRLPE